jgi:hypothetical protein
VVAVVGLFSLPVLVGLGARWSATAELEHLRQTNVALRRRTRASAMRPER